MKLLIVDDDILICSALARSFIRLGHTSRTASSVETALEMIASEVPAALLTDLDLGRGGNGVELISRLRASGNPLPAIMMTGSDVALARSQLAAAGLDGVAILEKPFPFEDLMTKLRELFPGEAPPAPPRKPSGSTMAVMMDNLVRAVSGRVV